MDEPEELPGPEWAQLEHLEGVPREPITNEVGGLWSPDRVHEHPRWGELTESQQNTYRTRMSRDPALSMTETATRLGVKPKTIINHWRTLRSVLGLPILTNRKPVTELTVAPEEATNADLARMMRRRLNEILISMGANDLKEAKLRDKAYAITQLVQQSQVLLEKPTSIHRMEDHRKLEEVSKMLLEEVKRRRIEVASLGTLEAEPL